MNIRRVSLSALIVVVASVPLLHAQDMKGPAPAPVPAQIAAAQKVFISNAGGESFETVFDQVVFNGGPDRPYNEFYGAMKNWSRFDLVSSPSEADLVFEINWALTDLKNTARLSGWDFPVLGQIRLVIVDPKTHIPLWTFTEYVRGAILLGNRDKNFDQAMNTIVNRLKILASAPKAASEPAQK